MGDASWRFEKQFELWQQHQTSVSRWAIGTAAFALLVPLFVLAPFDRLTGQVREVRAQLLAIEDKQRETERVGAQLDDIQGAIRQVGASLDAQPWDVDKERLVQAMVLLGRASGKLLAASPEELRDGEAARAELGHSRPQEPLRDSLSVRQMPPDLTSPQGLPPSETFDSGRTPNLPVGAGRPPTAQIPPTPEEPELDVLPIIAMAQALVSLDLDGGRLAQLGEPERFLAIGEQIEALAGQAADRMVDTVAARVERSAIEPLRKGLAASPLAAAAVPQLEAELQSMERDLADWTRAHRGNREWYRTVEGKGGAVASLAASLGSFSDTVGYASDTWQQRCEALISNQTTSVKNARDELAGKAEETRALLVKPQASVEKLGQKLDTVLPSWLGNLVSPSEMVQLFPAALLILTICIAFQSWKVRRIYRALDATAAQEKIPLGAVADSSSWTLVSRGAAPTGVTLLLHLGGILLLWLLFEQGSAIACRFTADEDEALTQLIQPQWQGSVRMLGRVLFVAALAAVALAMLRREKPAAAG